MQASAAGTVVGTVDLAQSLEGKGGVIGRYPRGRGKLAAFCRRCLGHNSRWVNVFVLSRDLTLSKYNVS